MAESSRKLVFVYGTLKRGHGNNRLLRNAIFIGEAVTDDNFVMYRIGFPYIAHEDSTVGEEEKANLGKVRGEVYEIDSEGTLQNLDRLESEGSFYKRVKHTVNGGQEVELYEIIRGQGRRFSNYGGDLVRPEDGFLVY